MPTTLLAGYGRRGVGKWCAAGVVIVSLITLSGCGGSSGSQQRSSPSNHEFDLINQRVAALNTAWNGFRSGVRTCPVSDRHSQAMATCFDQAYTSSGIDTAIADLHQQIGQIQGRLDPGGCRSALGRFGAKLAVLRRAAATFNADAVAGHIDRLKAEGTAVFHGWVTAVNAIAASDKIC
jgi:hypothetical protein